MFARALAGKDVDRLVELFADPLDFQALTPGRHWQTASARQAVEDFVLGHWFAPEDEIRSLLSVETAEVGDRERVTYRLAVTNPDGDFVVEQQAYYSVDESRISWIRMLCSGYRPMAASGDAP
jgi:hypothetical protein